MSAVMTPPAAPLLGAAWRHALPALVLVLLALLGLYHQTMAAMVGIWLRSDTFAHAILVPPITLWLVWRLRQRVASVAPRPQPWLLAALAIAALGWLVGDLAGVNALTQLMLTALLVLAVPAVLGWAVARELAFPLAFLFFMVPIGEFMMPKMMDWTADFTVAALQLSGIPVYREGLQFVIPSGNWSVVEACSGVRYLIASFMVGTLFAYLNYRSTKRRLVFCLVAIAVPIVANWVRAYIIVMLGHLSGNTIAVGVDHLVYGWVFFGIVIGFMFFIGAKWSEPDGNRNAALPPPAAAAVSGRAAPMALHWIVAAATVAIAAAPHAAAWQFERTGAAASAPALALPDVPGWSAVDAPPLLTPAFAAPSAEVLQVYRQDDRAVTVHVAYYRHQGYGRKLVSSQNQLVSSEDRRWNRSTSGRRGVEAGGRVVEFASHELLGGRIPGHTLRQRLDVRQVLWAGGRFTTSPQVATLLSVAGRLTGQGDDAAALTFYVEGEDAAATQRLLDDFLREHLGSFEARLQVARSVR
ncbi:MAG: exosortase A [Rubrivivax sp.]|nr:exosortase A [Rubrivivax sp.]